MSGVGEKRVYHRKDYIKKSSTGGLRPTARGTVTPGAKRARAGGDVFQTPVARSTRSAMRAASATPVANSLEDLLSFFPNEGSTPGTARRGTRVVSAHPASPALHSSTPASAMAGGGGGGSGGASEVIAQQAAALRKAQAEAAMSKAALASLPNSPAGLKRSEELMQGIIAARAATAAEVKKMQIEMSVTMKRATAAEERVAELEQQRDFLQDSERATRLALEKLENKIKHGGDDSGSENGADESNDARAARDAEIIAKLREANLKLEKSNSMLTNDAEGIANSMKTALAAAENEAKLEKTRATAAEAELAALKEEVESLKGARMEVAKLTSALDEATAEIESQQAEVEEARALKSLNRTIESEAARADAAEIAARIAKKEADAAEDAYSRAAVAEERAKSAEARAARAVEALTNEVHTQAQLESLTTGVVSLVRQLDPAWGGDSDSALEALRKAVLDAHQSAMTATSSAGEAKAALAEARSELRALQARASEIQGGLGGAENLSESQKSSEAAARRTRTRLVFVTKKLELVQAQLAEYEKDDALFSGGAIGTRNEGEESELARAQSLIQMQSQRIEAMEQDARDMSEMINTLERDLMEVRGRASGNDSEVAAAVARAEAAETRLAEAEAMLAGGGINPAKTKVLTWTESPMSMAVAEFEAQRAADAAELAAYRRGEGGASSGEGASGGAGNTEALQKKLDRLTKAFKQTAMDFREALYVLLGFRVDIETKKYRLRSIYAESESEVLVFSYDDATGTMSLMETDYSRQLQRGIERYMIRGKSIPAFLAAVIMEGFNKQTHIVEMQE